MGMRKWKMGECERKGVREETRLNVEASKVGKFEGQEKMENGGGKGRRSFLRRAEGQGQYNAKGTGCPYLFSV